MAAALTKYLVPYTWRPTTAFTAVTVQLKFRCLNAAAATTMAQSQIAQNEATNPGTLGTPTLDPDQSWWF